MDAEGLKELFGPFGAVAVKRMFGGKGVYADGLMFARDMDGQVYLKCDAETETLFEQAGSPPFIYQSRSGPMKVNFRRLSAGAFDDAEELKRWSALAMAAARRAAEVKAGKAKAGKARRPAASAKTARKS
ncbi:MAG: TfoX/Sxy family protein [Roseiarcus sp.]